MRSGKGGGEDHEEPYRVVTFLAVFGSHSFTRLSLLPEAMSEIIGCQSTAFTSHPCPARIQLDK